MTIEEYVERINKHLLEVQSTFSLGGTVATDLAQIGKLVLEHQTLPDTGDVEEDMLRTAAVYMLALKYFSLLTDPLLKGISIVQQGLGVEMPGSDEPSTPETLN